MTIRIGDLIAQLAADTLFGRERELALLGQLVERTLPILIQVHGIPGIGKSALLRHFSLRARGAGAHVIALDCRSTEPTESGFLRALAAASGCTMPDVQSAADEIGKLGSRVVLLLDHFDQFRLMDVWFHQTFIPAIPNNIRVATFGRHPPGSHWLAAPEWRRLMTSLRIDAIAAEDSEALLRDAGVAQADAHRILSTGRGHPLALHMAARIWREHPGFHPEEIDVSSVTGELANMALADVTDPATRRATEAASVVRRVNEPLLAAICPAEDAQCLYAKLAQLPIMKQFQDGLAMHDAVRHAIASTLHATAPERSRDYRTAAWRYMRTQIERASAAELWRNTADTIFLLQNPVVRDAFFPNAPQSLTARPACNSDGDAILQIVEQHDGAEALQHHRAWWKRQRMTFHVIENAQRRIVGFYCLAAADQIDPFLLVDDPVTASWWRHLRDQPLRPGEKVLFLRRWLSATGGELPCAVQAACWLDIKRTYLELRPALRRVYLGLHNMEAYEQVAGRLGFISIEDKTNLDGQSHHSAMLDFGSNSVDGWISELVGTELGQDEDTMRNGAIDVDARELILDQTRIALTKKEFALAQYLRSHARRAVPRDELLRNVWGWKTDGGSNVVDALVRSLRRKLGAKSTLIETVRGIGYRYRIPVESSAVAGDPLKT